MRNKDMYHPPHVHHVPCDARRFESRSVRCFDGPRGAMPQAIRPKFDGPHGGHAQRGVGRSLYDFASRGGGFETRKVSRPRFPYRGACSSKAGSGMPMTLDAFMGGLAQHWLASKFTKPHDKLNAPFMHVTKSWVPKYMLANPSGSKTRVSLSSRV